LTQIMLAPALSFHAPAFVPPGVQLDTHLTVPAVASRSGTPA
jgi:hypothetical protein